MKSLYVGPVSACISFFICFACKDSYFCSGTRIGYSLGFNDSFGFFCLRRGFCLMGDIRILWS